MATAANLHEDTGRPLSSRWLLAARAAWLGLAGAVLVLWAVDALNRAHAWSLGDFAFGLVMPAGFFAIAGFIFWRKSTDAVALLVSLMLIFLGPYLLSGVSSLGTAHPHWAMRLLTGFLVNTGGGLTMLFFAVFPSGTLAPRWVRYPLALGLALMVVFTGVELAQGIEQNLSPVALGVFLPFGLAAQIIRYRQYSSAPQQQQTKWIVVGFMGVAASLFFWVFLPRPAMAVIESTPLYFLLFTMSQSVLLLCLPVAIAVSILRYQLWDIDVIIRRAALYSALTTALAVVYLGSVLLLQGLFRALTGQAGQVQLTVVLSTLVIAALFGPLRARLQTTIDRRFYRRKYDAAKTLAAFGAALRDETDLDRLSDQLVGVVDETMQPERIMLWLKRADGAR
jgi:hypothetical protein